MLLLNVLDHFVELQEKSPSMSEKEINIAFDKIIMGKTSFEKEELTDEAYFLRRLYLREYFRDLRRIVAVHKTFESS